MTESCSTFVFVYYQFINYGHKRENCVIATPAAALVSLLETSYLVFMILVFPAVTIFAGLWSPGMHSKREGRSRVSVTPGKLMTRIGSLQRIHVIHQVGFLRTKCCR